MFTMLLNKQWLCSGKVRNSMSLRNRKRNKYHGSTCYISWQTVTNKITRKKIELSLEKGIHLLMLFERLNLMIDFGVMAPHTACYSIHVSIYVFKANKFYEQSLLLPLFLHSNLYVVRIQYDDWQWHFRFFNYSFHLRCIRFGNPRNMLHCMRSTHQNFSQCKW